MVNLWIRIKNSIDLCFLISSLTSLNIRLYKAIITTLYCWVNNRYGCNSIDDKNSTKEGKWNGAILEKSLHILLELI